MKKKGLALVLVLAMTLTGLAACGSSNENDSSTGGSTTTPTTAASNATPTTAAATTEEITLKVWESTDGPDKFIQQAGEAFTKLYPNIKIEYVNVELGDSTSQIALDGPAGVGPDLFAAPHDKLGELVTGGHVLATANKDTVAQTVLGSTVTALTYDGTMYGYPVAAETYALFYNKAYIAEAPKTFEEVVEFSTTFNAENSGKYGLMFDVGNIYYTILFMSGGGNALFGESGTDTSSTFLNNANAVKGMEYFQSLRSILNVPAADLTTSICDAAFMNGDSAMHISGPWNIANFVNAGLDFGVAPVPSLPGETTSPGTFSGARAMFVSAYSNHPTEAALFAQFLLSDEMQQLRFDITGALPSVEIEVESPYIAGFLQQLDYASPMPSVPQMSAFWDAFNSASANIWDGADAQTELNTADGATLAAAQ